MQRQLNLRQSPRNCGALHLLLAPSALVATLNTNLGPVVWKQKGVVGGSVDWKVFLLGMLDEAANCPRPCKANLHIQSSFFFSPFPIIATVLPLYSPKWPPPWGKGRKHQMPSLLFLNREGGGSLGLLSALVPRCPRKLWGCMMQHSRPLPRGTELRMS